MKRLFIPVLAAAAFAVSSCYNGNNANFPVIDNTEAHDDAHGGHDAHGKAKEEHFGEKISAAGAITTAEILAQLGSHDSLENIKMTAEIESVCQVKGCWMKLKNAAGEPIRVSFKDYAFFVPKDAAGKTAVVQGKAYKEVLSVDMQKHYAEDAGKSKEEIAAITGPKTEYSFEASGLIIK